MQIPQIILAHSVRVDVLTAQVQMCVVIVLLVLLRLETFAEVEMYALETVGHAMDRINALPAIMDNI